MGILNSFFTVNKTEELPRDPQNAPEPVSRLKSSTSVAPLTIAPLNTPPTLDPKIVETLESAVAEATHVEYAQFRAFVDSLSALPDNIRYSTALNVAAAAKLTSEQILKAMDVRIARLDNEKLAFEKWATSEYAQAVTARQSAAESAQQKIATLASQIQELTNEANTLTIEATAEATRLQESAQAFELAWASIKEKLSAERNVIVTSSTK